MIVLINIIGILNCILLFSVTHLLTVTGPWLWQQHSFIFALFLSLCLIHSHTSTGHYWRCDHFCSNAVHYHSSRGPHWLLSPPQHLHYPHRNTDSDIPALHLPHRQDTLDHGPWGHRGHPGRVYWSSICLLPARTVPGRPWSGSLRPVCPIAPCGKPLRCSIHRGDTPVVAESFRDEAALFQAPSGDHAHPWSGGGRQAAAGRATIQAHHLFNNRVQCDLPRSDYLWDLWH